MFNASSCATFLIPHNTKVKDVSMFRTEFWTVIHVKSMRIEDIDQLSTAYHSSNLRYKFHVEQTYQNESINKDNLNSRKVNINVY